MAIVPNYVLRRNIAENFNLLCRIQYYVTETLQTDGRATAYSEREREFAKMEAILPVEDHLVINFRRSITIAQLWGPEVARR